MPSTAVETYRKNLKSCAWQQAREVIRVDEEYKEAIREFYEVYRPLQKQYGLRMHSHFSIFDDDTIKIWEYHGDTRGDCICNVKEETDVACLRRATQELLAYGNRQ